MLWVALHLPLLSLESFAATLAGAARERRRGAGDRPRRRAPHLGRQRGGAGARRQARAEAGDRARARAAPHARPGRSGARRRSDAAAGACRARLHAPRLAAAASRAGRGGRHRAARGATRACATSAASIACSQRLQQAIAPLGHAVRIATAATAQGAAVLARVEPPPRCASLEATRQALAAAPVWLLGPGREHWEALQGMGLRQVGDLLGLPRAGLARRFGETLLAEIDAAFGRRPDPREAIVPARLFESRLELFARADSTEQVLHGASILLARLVAWLAAQHSFVRRFRLLMHHETRWQQGDRTPQATALEIALAEPSRDREHLLVLLRERLAQVQLPAPTLELALQAEDIVKRAAPNSELFPTPQSENEGLTPPDRAAAGAPGRRPGAAACRRRRPSPRAREPGAARRSAVRPPRAGRGRRGSARSDDGAAAASAASSSRPVWLQEVVEPLAELRSRPLARRPSAQPPVRPRADRSGLVGRGSGRARLLHRRGRRRRAGLDLPSPPAALGGGRERKRLVSSRPLRIAESVS